MLTDEYFVPAMIPIIHAIGVAMKVEEVWENLAPGSRRAKRGFEFHPFGVPDICDCPANQLTNFTVSVYVTILLQHFEVLLATIVKRSLKGNTAHTLPNDNIHIPVEFRHQ